MGKSWMATYLQRNHQAVRITNGKSADIAHCLDHPKIVIFDISRATSLDVFNFPIVEDIKNGSVFSPKYDSAVKFFDTPHVIIFANLPCPAGKFSVDRLRQFEILNDTLTEQVFNDPDLMAPPAPAIDEREAWVSDINLDDCWNEFADL